MARTMAFTVAAMMVAMLPCTYAANIQDACADPSLMQNPKFTFIWVDRCRICKGDTACTSCVINAFRAVGTSYSTDAAALDATLSCTNGLDVCSVTKDSNYLIRCNACKGSAACNDCITYAQRNIGILYNDAGALDVMDRCTTPSIDTTNCVAYLSRSVGGNVANLGLQLQSSMQNIVDRCPQNGCNHDHTCHVCLLVAALYDFNAADRCTQAAGNPAQLNCINDILAGASTQGFPSTLYNNREGFMDYCRGCGASSSACQACVPIAFRLGDYQLASKCSNLGGQGCGDDCQKCLITAENGVYHGGDSPVTADKVKACFNTL